MRFLPRTGKPSTIELAQLAAQDKKIRGKVTIDLRVPIRPSVTGRSVWKYVSLPATAPRFEAGTTTELYEFLRGLKWLLEHPTTWREHLK